MRADILPQTKFNSWTVIDRAPDKDERHRYLCRCSCGVEREVYKTNLTSGQSKSCGHHEKLLPGTKFGRWTVLGEAPPKDKGNPARYFCRCDCGTECDVRRSGLVSGTSKSCGCLQKEVAKDVVVQRCTTHGMSKSKTHRIWSTMVQRCTNPNNEKYAGYGGRGIAVCERWRNSFEDFLADMGERPDGFSIERLDNDQGYSPDNCIWADGQTQARNRRTTRLITAGGRTMPMIDWAEETGINYTTLWARLNSNWPPARALNML